MKSHEFIKLKESKKSGVADGELTPMQKLKKQVVQWPAKVPRGYELTAHGRLVKKSKTEKPNDGVGGQGMAEGDDLGNLDAVVFSRIDSEKKRLADLKKNNPEAYAREMAKEKSRSRIPPVSTFEEQGVAEDGSAEISSWGITPGEWGQFEELAEEVMTMVDSDEKWEAFWTNNVSRLNRLDEPLQNALDNGLASCNLDKLMGYILNGLRAGYQQSGTEPRAALDSLTYILKGSLRELSETSTVNGQRQDPKKSVWKQTSMSREAAVAKYGRDRVRSGGKNRLGQETTQVLVPLG